MRLGCILLYPDEEQGACCAICFLKGAGDLPRFPQRPLADLIGLQKVLALIGLLALAPGASGHYSQAREAKRER